jgi:hypothetical protein
MEMIDTSGLDLCRWVTMRAMGRSVLIALLLAAAPARAADATLDGWRDFQFGMSIDQTRQVPDSAWGALQTPPGSISILPSSGDVSDFGQSFRLRLFFGSADGLEGISLDHSEETEPQDCRVRYETLLSALEKRYGPFVPRQPIAPRGMQASVASLSASEYGMRIIPNGGGGLILNAQARHAFGTRAVEVAMFGIDSGRFGRPFCGLRLIFQGI